MQILESRAPAIVTHRIDSTVSSERAPLEPGLRNLGSMVPVTKQRTYHVMTRIGGGWSVRKEGASRASGIYDSKEQAIKRAREVARSAGGDIVIHNRDGLVQESTTYSRQPASAGAKRR